MSVTDCDVAVIGAGAAGLCAACDLCRHGYSVYLLEARGRVGGRIATRLEAGLDYPLELGAEFIHGEAPLTRELLRAAGIAAVDTAGQRIALRDGSMRTRGEEFELLPRLLEQAALLAQDISVEEFLSRYAAAPSLESLRARVRMMVEGFDAADPQRASIKAIAAEWSGQSLGGQGRPLGGYGQMLDALLRSLDPARSRVMLETVVESVEWGGERVRIQARGVSGALALAARQAVVTLPISLLRAADRGEGAVRFDPVLRDQQAALAGLELGPVIKVLLQFRRAFWEELDDRRFAEAGFLHAPAAPFPTVWTALPIRVPVLTAWMGGPRARLLAGADHTRLIEQALISAQQMLQVGNLAADELVAGHVHDWSADPFSRGAYCYVTVGGQAAPAALAKPLGAKLFFAGEATSNDYTGTVEAALQSGRRAARALIETTIR